MLAGADAESASHRTATGRDDAVRGAGRAAGRCAGLRRRPGIRRAHRRRPSATVGLDRVVGQPVAAAQAREPAASPMSRPRPPDSSRAHREPITCSPDDAEPTPEQPVGTAGFEHRRRSSARGCAVSGRPRQAAKAEPPAVAPAAPDTGGSGRSRRRSTTSGRRGPGAVDRAARRRRDLPADAVGMAGRPARAGATAPTWIGSRCGTTAGQRPPRSRACPSQAHTEQGLPVREPGARLVPGAADSAEERNCAPPCRRDDGVASNGGFDSGRRPSHEAPVRDPDAVRASHQQPFRWRARRTIACPRHDQGTDHE